MPRNTPRPRGGTTSRAKPHKQSADLLREHLRERLRSALGASADRLHADLVREATQGNADAARKLIYIAATGLEEGAQLPNHVREWLCAALWGIDSGVDANEALGVSPLRGRPPNPDRDDAIAAVYCLFLRGTKRRNPTMTPDAIRTRALSQTDQWIFDQGKGEDGLTKRRVRQIIERLCPTPLPIEFEQAADTELRAIVEGHFGSLPETEI